ncbi:MAG: NADPH:quinone oxidoreductase [Myxococcales bacterium]|nr:NADPH:quinone oxidoreductase [Myxococcales bacterium]
MRAVVCKTFGSPEELVVEELPSLSASSGQAVVRVRACGVNFPDTLIIAGKYQFRPEPPFSPGGEVAGEVASVGEGVTNVKVGDRVIALMPWGGYAEEVVTDAARLVPIPDGVDFVQAAATLTTYGTTYYALADRAAMQKGERLLVLGAAGGVGLAAVQLGKLMGARVIAAASSPDKLEICRANGADDLIDYAADDLKERVKAVTGGAGADVVYDPVGGKYSEAALRATAWNGRLLVVGFAAGEIPKIPLNLTLLKGAAILGVFWGQFTMREPARALAQFQQLLAWVAEGKLSPHIHATPPLAEAPAALRTLLDRKVQGKIVLVV